MCSFCRFDVSVSFGLDCWLCVLFVGFVFCVCSLIWIVRCVFFVLVWNFCVSGNRLLAVYSFFSLVWFFCVFGVIPFDAFVRREVLVHQECFVFGVIPFDAFVRKDVLVHQECFVFGVIPLMHM